MKNNLIKYTNKILFKDTVLKILTCIIIFAMPVILSIWGIINFAPSINIQLFLFSFSVIYLIAFMFLSYEYIYKLKSNTIIECINATPNGSKSVVKSKILLLSFVAALETIILIVVILIFALFDNTLILQNFIYIVLSTVLNIFLLSIAGIFIGSFAGIKMKKIPAYLLMIVITVMTSRLLNTLWIGLFTSTNINLFNLTGLFELTAPSTNWTPNTAFGYSFLPYRFAVLFLWIIIFAFGLILSLHKIEKRKIKSAICIVLAIVCLVTYFLPSSKVIMDEKNIEGPNADNEYYIKNGNNLMTQKSNFNITDLTMDISINLQLKAKVIIKVDNNNLDKYKFTLYHGYNITGVAINNENVDFERCSDYLKIANENRVKIDTVTINYSGYCARYYSNIQGAVLPGFLPYYPMAGYKEVFDSNYQSFIANRADNNINFDVKITSLNRFYSNLNEDSRNHFTGSSKSLTLVSGLYKAVTYEGIEIIYPYTDVEELSDDLIEINIKNFKDSNVDSGKTKTIIVMPRINQGRFETVYSDEDYILSEWITDIQDDYAESLINKDKIELYYCIEAYENNNDYYQQTKEYFDFSSAFEENLKKSSNTEFYEECYKYLFDSDDKRTITEFLSDLLEEK